MSVRFLFAWYDLWVGAFWDRANRRLYVLPLPMVGVVIQFPQVRYVYTAAEAGRRMACCCNGQPPGCSACD